MLIDKHVDNLCEIKYFVGMFYINNMDNSVQSIHYFFFLNNVGDTMFFKSVCKMSHIFRPKLHIVSESYITVLIILNP